MLVLVEKKREGSKKGMIEDLEAGREVPFSQIRCCVHFPLLLVPFPMSTSLSSSSSSSRPVFLLEKKLDYFTFVFFLSLFLLDTAFFAETERDKREANFTEDILFISVWHAKQIIPSSLSRFPDPPSLGKYLDLLDFSIQTKYFFVD